MPGLLVIQARGGGLVRVVCIELKAKSGHRLAKSEGDAQPDAAGRLAWWLERSPCAALAALRRSGLRRRAGSSHELPRPQPAQSTLLFGLVHVTGRDSDDRTRDSSCTAKTLGISRSYRSAQRWDPVVASINWHPIRREEFEIGSIRARPCSPERSSLIKGSYQLLSPRHPAAGSVPPPARRSARNRRSSQDCRGSARASPHRASAA
jgi:hypothetical protein